MELLFTIIIIAIIVARCKVLKKLNKTSWYGIIPLLGFTMICRKSKIPIWLVMLYYLGIIIVMYSLLVLIISGWWGLTLSLLTFFQAKELILEQIINYQKYEFIFYITICLVYMIRLFFGYKMALAFGKNKSISIIYGILNPIVMILLGFGKDKYLGR